MASTSASTHERRNCTLPLSLLEAFFKGSDVPSDGVTTLRIYRLNWGKALGGDGSGDGTWVRSKALNRDGREGFAKDAKKASSTTDRVVATVVALIF
jgi:hypothetical protein